MDDASIIDGCQLMQACSQMERSDKKKRGFWYDTPECLGRLDPLERAPDHPWLRRPVALSLSHKLSILLLVEEKVTG